MVVADHVTIQLLAGLLTGTGLPMLLWRHFYGAAAAASAACLFVIWLDGLQGLFAWLLMVGHELYQYPAFGLAFLASASFSLLLITRRRRYAPD